MRTSRLLFRSCFPLILASFLAFFSISKSVAEPPDTPRVAVDTTFRLWEHAPEVKELRRLLARQGLLDSTKIDDDRYDLDVMEAVRTFQRRAGLRATGIPRRKTLVALDKAPSSTAVPSAPPPGPTMPATAPAGSTKPAPAPSAKPIAAAPSPSADPRAPSSPTPTTAPSVRAAKAPVRSAPPAAAAATARAMLNADSVQKMTDAVAHYRALVAAGGWQGLAGAARFTLGQPNDMIPALRARLAAEGYLTAAQTAGAIYDAALATALHRFRRNHGLLERDAIDSATLAELNVPAAARLVQLESTLARLRRQNIGRIDLAGEPYVLLNVPARTVEYALGGRVMAWRKVIVGKRRTKSPDLLAYIDGITLDPTWRVPDSIVRREIAPMLRRNPKYLDRQGMRIMQDGAVVDPTAVDWKKPVAVIQRPGAHNALGVLRIDMPNRHAVYLHDTPQRRLFDSANRYFSHGCARVEDVVGFAEMLLHDTDPALTRQALTAEIAAYDGGWEPGRTISLKRKIRVIWVYMTAWVTEDGSVAFRRDVYRRDKPVAAPPSPAQPPASPAREVKSSPQPVATP